MSPTKTVAGSHKNKGEKLLTNPGVIPRRACVESLANAHVVLLDLLFMPPKSLDAFNAPCQ